MTKKRKENLIDEFGFTPLQYKALQLLSSNAALSDQQKILLGKFIEQSMGDLSLNKKLKMLLNAKNVEAHNIKKEIVEKLIYFTYKTRRKKEFPAIFEKIKKNENRIKNKMKLDEKHRITLSEYAIFNDFSDMKEIFSMFNDNIEYKENSSLGRLHEKINQAHNLNAKIKRLYETELKIPPGTVAAHNLKRMTTITGPIEAFKYLIKRMITKHIHTSKLLTKEGEGKIIASHITSEYKQDSLPFKEYLYSDLYQIKIENLISNRNKAILEKIYGPNWLRIVENRYSEIERKLHDEIMLSSKKLYAVPSSDASLKKWIGFSFSRLRSIFSTFLPFEIGHTRAMKADFSQIHKRVTSHKHGCQMICSEFVAITTIAALVELNKQLIQDAKSEDLAFMRDQDPIKNPISQHEDLKNMLPDRFLLLLKKAKCLEKIKKPKKIQRYFKT